MDEMLRLEKLKRIATLMHNLQKTDYQAIKYAEGEITLAEYAGTRASRKAWRAEINSLQQELKNPKE